MVLVELPWFVVSEFDADTLTTTIRCTQEPLAPGNLRGPFDLPSTANDCARSEFEKLERARKRRKIILAPPSDTRKPLTAPMDAAVVVRTLKDMRAELRRHLRTKLEPATREDLTVVFARVTEAIAGIEEAQDRLANYPTTEGD